MLRIGDNLFDGMIGRTFEDYKALNEETFDVTLKVNGMVIRDDSFEHYVIDTNGVILSF